MGTEFQSTAGLLHLSMTWAVSFALILACTAEAHARQASPIRNVNLAESKQPDLTRNEKGDDPDREAADRCRNLLIKSVFEFYYPGCLDQQHLGYLETIDDQGNFVGGEKFLTLQARQLWFFSALAANDFRREESLAAARSGYAFLSQHFHDEPNGGYFLKTTRAGEPVDSRKHVYPLSFVIYALVEYHRATGEPEPLKQAKAMFDLLDRHCYDKQNGGYNELFTADWKPITDQNEWGVVGAVGHKTYNTHLHLLEAFTALFRQTRDPTVAKRLTELILINVQTVRHKRYPCNIDAWSPDWRMVENEKNLCASYGHDLECSWLVMDAADALGQFSGVLKPWAIEICEHAIEFGWDKVHHGFYYSGPLGNPADDRAKQWWTQAESLVAMLSLEKLTGDKKYRGYFDKTLSFIEEHQISPQGGWWSVVNENGSVGQNVMRASMWKGAYHDGRALLSCEKLLRMSRSKTK